MHPMLNLRASKTPTDARRLVPLLLFAVLAAPLPASAQPLLSEADVIRMARAKAPASAVARATDELADARARTAGLLPNPSVSWSRETVETEPRSAQDIVLATLPIDVARPRAARALAASEGAWMRAQAATARTEAVLEALLAYYAVALAERRIDVLADAVANLEEAARVLERREAAGTASGYETTRLSVASELMQSRLAEARGTVDSARARLAALLAVPEQSLEVDTSLTLAPAQAEAAWVATGGASREVVEQARESKRFAAQARDRAGLTWLPNLDLAAGLKHVSDFGGGVGYVVGLGLSIPVFDRGQALRAEAEARTVLSAARADAVTRTIRAEIESARAVYRAARQERDRFEAKTARQVETLLRAAQSGYREGERTIMELLDAQRAQTDVAERSLTLLGSAKRAEARLRAAAGDFQ